MRLKICATCKKPYLSEKEFCPNCPAPYIWNQESYANVGCLLLMFVPLVFMILFWFLFFLGIFIR